jgi:hypothetical protein
VLDNSEWFCKKRSTKSKKCSPRSSLVSMRSSSGRLDGSPIPSESLALSPFGSEQSIIGTHRRIPSARSTHHSRHSSQVDEALRDTAASMSQANMLEWPIALSASVAVSSTRIGSSSTSFATTQHAATSIGTFDLLSPTAPRSTLSLHHAPRVRTSSMLSPTQSPNGTLRTEIQTGGATSPRSANYGPRIESPRSVVFVRQVASPRALDSGDHSSLVHRRSPLVLSGSYESLAVPTHPPTPTRRSFTSGVYHGESSSPHPPQPHRHSFTSGTTGSSTPPRSSTSSSTSSQAHTPARSPVPPQLKSSPQRPVPAFPFTSTISATSTTTKDSNTPTSSKRLFPNISGAVQQVTPIQPISSSTAGIPDFDLDNDSGVFSLSRPASAARPQFSSAAPSTYSSSSGLISPTSNSNLPSRPMPPPILTAPTSLHLASAPAPTLLRGASSPLRPKPVLPKSLAPLQPQSRRVFQNVTAAVEDMMGSNSPATAPSTTALASGWSAPGSREDSPCSSPPTGSPTRSFVGRGARQQDSPGGKLKAQEASLAMQSLRRSSLSIPRPRMAPLLHPISPPLSLLILLPTSDLP